MCSSSLLKYGPKTYKDYLGPRYASSIFLCPTGEYEVLQAYNNHISPGVTDIPVKIIKQAKFIIANLLVKAFNHCTENGVYPDILKLAKGIPLHKGSSKQNLGNSIPISILSPFNEICELLLRERILNFWNKHDLFSKHQFGFREHFSTGLAITQAFESLVNNKGINKSSCAIFLDLAKAFDSINHQILLDKIEHYGVRGVVHSLFKSYLENRKQCVSCKDVSSTFLPIATGVPQGSVLGPFLFLVYINDLPLCSKFSTTLYADDTVLICSDKNINSLNLKTNEELEKINLWFLSNK